MKSKKAILTDYFRNLKKTDNRNFSILNCSEQRKIIAKTKFLTDLCELYGLIDANKRINIKNRCNNCINYNEYLDAKTFDYLKSLLKNRLTKD